jgi:LPXTG-motif cell wall-anchored protein
MTGEFYKNPLWLAVVGGLVVVLIVLWIIKKRQEQ